MSVLAQGFRVLGLAKPIRQILRESPGQRSRLVRPDLFGEVGERRFVQREPVALWGKRERFGIGEAVVAERNDVRGLRRGCRVGRSPPGDAVAPQLYFLVAFRNFAT